MRKSARVFVICKQQKQDLLIVCIYQSNDLVGVTLCLLVSCADNFCKQFGPRSGPTKFRARSGFKLFDTLIIFLREAFEKVDFEKTNSKRLKS